MAPAFARQSGRGQPHSKTLTRCLMRQNWRGALECGCPLPLMSPRGKVSAVLRPYTRRSRSGGWPLESVFDLLVDRATYYASGSAQVQPAEEPHFEPVEAGEPDEPSAGHGEKERGAERRHEDAAQRQDGRDTQAQHGTGHKEGAGPGPPEMAPLARGDRPRPAS